MNSVQSLAFRAQLEEMKARLESEVSGLEKEAFRPTAGMAALGADTQSDAGSSAAQEEVARTLYGAESGTLAEINAALERLDAGRFGVCESCDGTIAHARLKVLPFARRCQKCAQAAEVSDR
ncbi:MAG: TraR/DksA C4-type zinc finger protein [Gemmataceae bacterium]